MAGRSEKSGVGLAEFLASKSRPVSKKIVRKFDYAKGFFEMPDDFDEPLDDFK